MLCTNLFPCFLSFFASDSLVLFQHPLQYECYNFWGLVWQSPLDACWTWVDPKSCPGRLWFRTVLGSSLLSWLELSSVKTCMSLLRGLDSFASSAGLFMVTSMWHKLRFFCLLPLYGGALVISVWLENGLLDVPPLILLTSHFRPHAMILRLPTPVSWKI